METRRIPVFALALAAAAALCLPVVASAQFTLNESGFDVTSLGNGAGPKGAACSPGGVWGDYVYIGDSNGNAIERIDFFDNVSFFAGGAPDIAFPVGMDFGPGPASDFGAYLYVASYGSGQISRVDPAGTTSLFKVFASVSDVKFDPTGAYSNELFAITYFGAISKVSSAGAISAFSPGVAASYFRFGPGGAWGTGMYAASNGAPGTGIITVDSGGTPALFSGGFLTPEQFDWAFGGAWGGDMFATDFADGKVYRVKSDGSKTLFGTCTRPAGLVFCNDCIYLTSFAGECWRICESAVPAKPTSWGLIKQLHREAGEE